MTISLPLESMTVEEKIQAMEMLWDDLCRESGGVVSPEWHKSVLSSREHSAQDKDYVDWDEAKKQIRKEVE